MEIRDWEKLIFSGSDPFFSFMPLTLWTVPVSTRIVTNVNILAAITLINMTTEFMRSTFSQGM
jgi:hypothetical protein